MNLIAIEVEDGVSSRGRERRTEPWRLIGGSEGSHKIVRMMHMLSLVHHALEIFGAQGFLMQLGGRAEFGVDPQQNRDGTPGQVPETWEPCQSEPLHLVGTTSGVILA